MSSTKHHLSGLFDILSVAPGLFEDLARLKIATSLATTRDPSLHLASPVDADEEKRSLQGKVDKTVSSLNQWYQNWSSANQDALQTISSPHQFSATKIPYSVPLFGLPLLFPSLLQANEYTMYNATLFVLLTITNQLSLSPSIPFGHRVESRDRGQTPTSSMAADAAPTDIYNRRRQVALEICKAVPYHLQFDLHAYSGAFLLCLPLNILFGICGSKTEDGQWVARVLTDIASNWGIMAGNSWLREMEEKEARGSGITR